MIHPVPLRPTLLPLALMLALALACPPLPAATIASSTQQQAVAAPPAKPQAGVPADNANRKPGANGNAGDNPDDNADDNDTDVDDGDDPDIDDDPDEDTASHPSSPCPHKARSCWPEEIEREQQRLDALPAPDGAALADQLGDSLYEAAEFGGMEQEPAWYWQWRFQSPSEKKNAPGDTPWLRALREFLQSLSRGFGTLGHVALWLLLLFLLVLLWRRRDDLLGTLARRATAHHVVAGVDIAPLLSPDALPDDVLAGVERLWQAHHPREALSLLYRAALHRLGARHDFAIPESGTEAECLALVERHAGRDVAASFRVLVHAWMRMAWQDRAPAELAPLRAAWRRTAGLPPEDTRAEFAGGAA